MLGGKENVPDLDGETIPVPQEGAVQPPPSPATSVPPSAPSSSGSIRDPLTPLSEHAVSHASATALIALHAEEAERTSSFGRVVAALAGLGIIVHMFYGGHRVLWWMMAGALVVGGLTGLWAWRRARDPSRYTTSVNVIFGVIALICSCVFNVYFGVFSPAPVVVAFGIGFFGLVDEGRVVVFMCGVAAAIYMTLAMLVALNVMPDHGLFATKNATIGERIGMATMVVAIYMASLWQARSSRRATREAIERSNKAVLLAQAREAQLEEANQNLDVALRAGAGRGGRYTGQVAGKYKLAEVVGRGAMGEVYAATHTETGSAAAVKLLHANVLVDPSLARRFVREAEIAKSLVSPNVVRVHEVGQASDGAPFIAMELLAGHDLAWHLRQRRHLSLSEVVILVEEVARGLAVAHAAGVIHRDLKPQNLHLSEGANRAWKIVDFGVSKLRDSTGTLTEGAMVGTPGYMAPEQVRGQSCDHRADLFSLGAVAYRALTGRPPFSGSDVNILFDLVYKNPMRPSDVYPGVPRDVEAVLAIALAKRADERFADAKEMAIALRAAARGELAPKLRAQAEGILHTMPWGKTDETKTLPS